MCEYKVNSRKLVYKHRILEHEGGFLFCKNCDFKSQATKIVDKRVKRKHREGAKILFDEGRYSCDVCAFYSEEL